MTCRDLVAFLMTYLSGELPADRRAEFERHLGACPDCQTFLRQYRDTMAASRAALEDPGPALPDDLIAAIKASIFPK